jgi:hypothetical protein
MLADMEYALRHANTHHCTVIVVVPPDQLEQALTNLVAMAGDQGVFGGRSLLGVSGSRLTIADVMSPVGVAPFDVLFVGWGSLKATASEEMTRWRKAARQIVTRAA